ncbi:hypothetical protein THAOC_31482, partial [Thalassiosira oceanica]
EDKAIAMSMSGNNSGDDLRSDGGGGNPDWHPPPPPPYGYAAPYGYEEGQVRSYAYYAARPPLPPPPPPQYHPPTDAYGGYGGYYNRPHLQNHHVHAPSRRPGENMSTNGAESRGKEAQKGQTSALSGEADEKEESKNPIHMLAGFGIDANIHMPLEDPLNKFAVNAPRDDFIDSALDELRKVSSYSPPKTVTSSARRVQTYLNLTSTFLYSIVTVDGVETPHELILGNKQVPSFTIHFPTSSRVFTSLSLLMQADIEKYSQAPAGMKSRFILEETKNVQKLIHHLQTLRPKETQALYQMLAEKRRANTPELQAHENLTMYLQRRAHRNIDPKWAEPTPPSKSGAKGGKKGAKGKKGKGNSDPVKVIRDFEQLTQERLAQDKDAGAAEVISTASDVRPKKGGFMAEQLPIDGEDGILESALSW